MIRTVTAQFAKSYGLVVLLLALLIMPTHEAQACGSSSPAGSRVSLILKVEDWVTTKTARVLLNVEAAVTANTAGSMRKEMEKAVNAIATSDWRITNFRRAQDKTGMERWSATFESRLPEVVLSGLNEQAKKESKAGLQVTVMSVDFDPTLEEKETVKQSLRTQIYKRAKENLADLNKTMEGQTYHIANIRFTESRQIRPQTYKRTAKTGEDGDLPDYAPDMELSQKMTLSATVDFATETDPLSFKPAIKN